MFTKFWDKLAESIAVKWSERLGPALVYWGGGLLAWGNAKAWQSFLDFFKAHDSMLVYIALASGGLLILVVSGILVEWLEQPALRFAEGYWPRPFRRLRFRLAEKVGKRLQRKESKWEELRNKDEAARTAAEQAVYAQLDAELATYPADERDLMPTTLGNLLRACEKYPDYRYGLAISVCWPRLWLLLPRDIQKELITARHRLNAAVSMLLWGLFFMVWTIFTWWPAVVALIVTAAAYWRLCQAAGVYGDLLRAAFDLHRFKLYDSLRLPPPQKPTDEVTHGQRLTEYLFRGTGFERTAFIESTSQDPSRPGNT